jgi:hypothetical protein
VYAPSIRTYPRLNGSTAKKKKSTKKKKNLPFGRVLVEAAAPLDFFFFFRRHKVADDQVEQLQLSVLQQ